MDDQQRINDTATVLYFLYGSMRADLMYQGHKGGEAFYAACRLLGINASAFIRLQEMVDEDDHE